MKERPDISSKLIHFTLGDSYDDAFNILCTIMNERKILGGNRMIRGGYKYVCLTEAPLPALCDGSSESLNFK